MAPIVTALSQADEVESRVCVTAQHREMLDQVLHLFDIKPDWDLQVMREGQSLGHITSRVIDGLAPILADYQPDRVLVHGDTTTTFAAAVAAFYAHVPVAHVEAGLRTGDPLTPWPEEMNRRLAGRIADLHFAPTDSARLNLLQENVSEASILVTGNSVIDALHQVETRLTRDTELTAQVMSAFGFLDERPMLLVTGHRRENFGPGLAAVCSALKTLAQRGDVQIVYAVHLNPNVKGPVEDILGGQNNVHLIPPQDYLPFVALMQRAHLVITDSGGIQEEAPALGKPVLVTRDVTERPEAVEAGTVKLVGPKEDRIVAEASRLLDDMSAYGAMAKAVNPYGDGHAASRIVAALKHEAGLGPAPEPWLAKQKTDR